MASRFEPRVIQDALASPRWTAQVRLDAAPVEVAQWDPTLVREPRVLVPIDVQALFVPEGDTTAFVRLPFSLTTPDGQPEEPMPAPFDGGAPRPPGVHLHWMPPDSLLRGEMSDGGEAARNRLGMAVLPDRWVVLRIVAPTSAAAVAVKGWVIEADTAKVIPLEQWPAGSAAATPEGKTVPRNELTGTVGGSLNWIAGYDAVRNRCAFHDPLADLPGDAFGDLAAYLVAGWWSDPRLDPLDRADTDSSLQVRLNELGYRLTGDAGRLETLQRATAAKAVTRESLGLSSGGRFGAATAATSFTPAVSKFVEGAGKVLTAPPRHPRQSLLHGVVYGVPVRGQIVLDQRPAATDVDVAIGLHGDDLAAVLASAGLAPQAAPERRAVERLLAAFTGQVLSELGTPDGVVAADEHEHQAAFASRDGGPGPIERLRTGGEAGPLNAGRAARSEQARIKAAGRLDLAVRLSKIESARRDLVKGTLDQQREALGVMKGPAPETDARTEIREVRRPAPRFFAPLEPMIAVRNARRSLRLQGGPRFSPDGKLQVRHGSQVATVMKGLADGRDLIAGFPTGGIPDEILTLARSAVIYDPYLSSWLADIEAKRRGLDRAATRKRFAGEMAVRYSRDGVYDGGTAVLTKAAARSTRLEVADQLRRFSLYDGVDPDPVSVTTWSQPWVPLWIEWEVELATRADVAGWTLGAVDLESDDPKGSETVTLQGRGALHAGTAATLAGAIDEWLKAERERDADNQGEVDDATAAALRDVSTDLAQLDVLTASFEGFHERLLGLPVDNFGLLLRRASDGSIVKPTPAALPRLLLSGVLRLTRARIIDGFGRTLDLPVDRVRMPARDESGGALALRPRLLPPARWLFRLVDPAVSEVASGNAPAEATIDQIDPSQQINPVAGFLLPDHMDEALEVFDASGRPIGQLMHEPFGGGVTWEIAPGRSGPADAGPGFDLGARQQILGLLATSMVAEDARERGGAPRAETESTLSAFLRAVDTTLWTVDTFTGFGTQHIAGLVGRPIAVVRATLSLDIQTDLDELLFGTDSQRAARQQAFDELTSLPLPVRLGELTRADDGLLGFFVDDDYTRFHVVDRTVRDGALDVGRGIGQFAQFGATKQLPDSKPITIRYIVGEDELLVRPGQVLRLTLLMHPSSRVHLTSGILPRKHLQLARDWVEPALAVMAPSVRVGPVLVDPQKIRLPKVSSFPKDQLWTRRDTPSTWKDDPILAATQTALLPDAPADVQEGYIRVAPDPASGGGA